jgi:hypothetical protein
VVPKNHQEDAADNAEKERHGECLPGTDNEVQVAAGGVGDQLSALEEDVVLDETAFQVLHLEIYQEEAEAARRQQEAQRNEVCSQRRVLAHFRHLAFQSDHHVFRTYL